MAEYINFTELNKKIDRLKNDVRYDAKPYALLRAILETISMEPRVIMPAWEAERTHEKQLVAILEGFDKVDTRALYLSMWIQEYGPVSEECGQRIRRLLEGHKA